MTFWNYVGAIAIILAILFMIFAGVFEWIALREQNEPKGKNFTDFPQYYRENPDKRPKD